MSERTRLLITLLEFRVLDITVAERSAFFDQQGWEPPRPQWLALLDPSRWRWAARCTGLGLGVDLALHPTMVTAKPRS